MSNRPPTKRIACDECPVIVDGQTYFPHVGEWVEAVPFTSIRETMVWTEFLDVTRISVDIAAAEDDPEVSREVSAKQDAIARKLLQLLSERIIQWNLKDAYGRELPSPDTPEALESLTWSEMWWLWHAVRSGGASAEEGKDESGTPTTSLDSKPLDSPASSSTDHSLRVAD